MPWLKRYLWTILWLMLGPGFFLTVVPWWLAGGPGSRAWTGEWPQWAAAWLILNGACIAGWCALLFFSEGQGTPLPAKPPVRFVARGPYRFVRNPMVLGLLMLLAGEVLFYQSGRVLAYGLVIASLAVAFVLQVEEKDLERRFGPLYCAYKKQVPRWIPRRTGKLDL